MAKTSASSLVLMDPVTAVASEMDCAVSDELLGSSSIPLVSLLKVTERVYSPLGA